MVEKKSSETLELPPFNNPKIGGKNKDEYKDGEKVHMELIEYENSNPRINVKHQIDEDLMDRYTFIVTDKEQNICTYKGDEKDILIDIYICLDYFGFTTFDERANIKKTITADQYLDFIIDTLEEIGLQHKNDPLYESIQRSSINSVENIRSHYLLFNKVGEENYNNIIDESENYLKSIMKREKESEKPFTESKTNVSSVDLNPNHVFMIICAVAQSEGYIEEDMIEPSIVENIVEGDSK